ncbi:hypothetical protein LCGC14_2149110, partial [marine sediment metagenome]
LREKARPSMVVTAIPITERKLPKLMSFAGEVNVPARNQRIDGTPRNTYSTSDYYERIWGYTDLLKPTFPGTDTFLTRQHRMSEVSLQGRQALWNESRKNFSRWVIPQGHRGFYGDYPGAAKVWDGAMRSLQKFDYASLELP